MTSNTKNVTSQVVLSSTDQATAVKRTADDLKHSILIVSAGINLFIFTGWLALQVTNAYDAEVAAMLFR